jgi:hypothetical protein
VQNIAVGNIEYGTDVTAEESQTIALLYTDTNQNPLTMAEADGFKLWLQTRLDTNKLLLIISPQPTTNTPATASTTAQ